MIPQAVWLESARKREHHASSRAHILVRPAGSHDGDNSMHERCGMSERRGTLPSPDVRVHGTGVQQRKVHCAQLWDKWLW